MPEGHTLRRLADDLNAAFSGSTVMVSSPQGRFAAEAALLHGTEFVAADSAGKHLFCEFEGDRIVAIHLGLIGKFSIGSAELPSLPEGFPPAPMGAVRLRISTGHHYADLRGATKCVLATAEQRDATIAALGPDPLRAGDDLTRAWHRISRSERSIGELLMDQSVLAGVGNVYRAEVLFRHRINPTRPGRTLRRGQFEAMWADLVVLMAAGVVVNRIDTVRPEHSPEAMGREPRVDDHGGEVYVYRRHGQACLVCGSRVRTAVLGGRNSFWCPKCQPVFRSRAGRPSAN